MTGHHATARLTSSLSAAVRGHSPENREPLCTRHILKLSFEPSQSYYLDNVSITCMHRRKFIQLIGLSLSLALTGCLSTESSGNTTDSANNTDSGSSDNRGADPHKDVNSDSTASGESGLSGNAKAAQTPDPDHQIQVKNEKPESVNATVTVRRVETGETVHNQTYTIRPDAVVTAYNTRQATPDGIEQFTVSVTSDGSTNSFTLETDQCMHDLEAQVTESAGIDWFYAVC